MNLQSFETPGLDSIQTHYLRLSDGRRIAYARYGKTGGTPVYYFHGCPGSRFEAAPCHKWACQAGFEVFAFDRPGCGQSAHASGYQILDWATDVRDIADRMLHQQFGIMGLSGGGAYIQACAYAIPERLLFAYDLAGWAPVKQVTELQDSLAPLDRFFLKRASSFPVIFYFFFTFIGFAAKYTNDRFFAQSLRSSMGEDDKRLILGDKTMQYFFRCVVAESFAQGVRGPADDALRCYGDWGFLLSDVNYPVQIWHGTDDKFADVSFAKMKHRAIVPSSLNLIEGRGHLYFTTIYEQLFVNVLEQCK